MALLGLTLLTATPSFAQATRTWVSGVGDDANPCSRTAPCKTFAGAISKTAPAGEINCLDPGGFGALTITKSITISCEAGTAGVLVSGTNGIVVSAASTDQVYLRGLDFEGIGTGLSGVLVNTAAVVHIDQCLIRGFATAGVSVTPSSGAVLVQIADTKIADNSGEGIIAKPTGSGATRVVLDRVVVSHNTGDGVFANANVTSGNVRVLARNTDVDHNGADGFTVLSNSGKATIMLDASTAFNNNRGLSASGAQANLAFTRTTVTANGTGVNQDTSAVLTSYQTNVIAGNGTDVVGTLSTANQN
jgi:hypothetical protein